MEYAVGWFRDGEKIERSFNVYIQLQYTGPITVMCLCYIANNWDIVFSLSVVKYGAVEGRRTCNRKESGSYTAAY